MQDTLEGVIVKLRLSDANATLEDEVARLSGARYERRLERDHTRYGRHGAW
jgi:hypothetical protein